MAGAQAMREAGGRRPVQGRQTSFLSQSIILEEIGPPRMVRILLFLVTLMIVGFVAWAAATGLVERTSGSGEVVPTGAVQSVQHLEGGIVSEILVKDGALVEPRTLLVRLDQTAARAALEETRARMAALEVQAERLRAFSEGRNPDFSVIGRDYPGLVADQLAIARMHEHASASQGRVIEYQILQRIVELEVLEKREETLKRQVTLMSEQARMHEELVRKGLVSRMVYLSTMQELNAAQGELRNVRGMMSRAVQAVAESTESLMQLDSRLRNEAVTEMGGVTSELAQLRRAVARHEDRVERLDIRAPVRGVVKGLRPNTIGGVVAPGAIIAEIVPVDEELVVEVRIPPGAIGQIRKGLPAAVKITTFDFGRYGSVDGVVQRISATTFRDEENGVYYKATVELAKNHVGDDPARNIILPGMTVRVDINTGDRTVLQYLLNPVYEYVSNAFGEG